MVSKVDIVEMAIGNTKYEIVNTTTMSENFSSAHENSLQLEYHFKQETH